MRSKTRYLVPLLIFLVIISFFGYRYRGRIRIAMLDFLHSFDDAGQGYSRDTAHHGDANDGLSPAGDDSDEQEQLELIRSLGYLSGYEEAPSESNVTLYDTVRAFDGYNVLISGHAPGVSMIDMEGTVVHEWFTDEANAFSLWTEEHDSEINFDLWRRVHLFSNGDLLALVSGGGVIKVDHDSNLLWASDYLGAHHDLDVDESGNIYVVGRKVHINERYNPDEYISEDYLYILDSLGNTVDEISILDLIEESQFAPVLRRSAIRTCMKKAIVGGITQQEMEELALTGDVLHCNSVAFIREGQLPENYQGPLRESTVLLSLRTVDLVCALDLEDRSLYWAESDMWHMQHEPVVLTDGNILIFDNLGTVGASTLTEFDPETREIEWLYRGDEENPFFSAGIGSCQRLSNGNTLITESMSGRAFEVTPEKEIVWEYFSPYRSGENNELIATLHEVFRVNEDYVSEWLTAD